MQEVDLEAKREVVQEVARALPWDRLHNSKARLLHKHPACHKCLHKAHSSNSLWCNQSTHLQVLNHVLHRGLRPGPLLQLGLEVDHARILFRSRAALRATRMVPMVMSRNVRRSGQRRPRLNEAILPSLDQHQNLYAWQLALRARFETFDLLAWLAKEPLQTICKRCPEPLRQFQLSGHYPVLFSNIHRHQAS